MTTPIPMDDLRPDQWVTIRDEIKDVPMSPFGADPELHQFVMRMRSRTPVKPGTPMRVIAVDLPFLYTVVLDADGQEQGPLILDVRRFRVVEICTSVPQAILEFADVKLRSNYEHSLATAATEAAVEAKAELVKLDLLSEATETDGEGDAEGDPHPDGDANSDAERDTDAREDGDAKSNLNNRDPRSANNRQHAAPSIDHWSYDNSDESEHPLDRWFRGDDHGEAASENLGRSRDQKLGTPPRSRMAVPAS